MLCQLVLMLLITFRGETLLSTCFLLNRIPHRTTDKTPYELCRDYQPNLKYLKVWEVQLKSYYLSLKSEKQVLRHLIVCLQDMLKKMLAYILFVLKNVLVYNTILETKNAEFFQNIFSLQYEYEGSYKQPLEINC